MIALEAVRWVVSRVAPIRVWPARLMEAYISRKDACVPVVPIWHQ